ncbi:MAG: hypothetical protein EZS28_056124 [Streblomastix strix]|uniref:Uncharacterized protein n=1 Tax=Streblomastix strix TaxID=222440 RepID=A0A5J4PPK5_9EUKA|nr:MAG: hypothetical protein EZS28_056124 [Streblomastix strix]
MSLLLSEFIPISEFQYKEYQQEQIYEDGRRLKKGKKEDEQQDEKQQKKVNIDWMTQLRVLQQYKNHHSQSRTQLIKKAGEKDQDGIVAEFATSSIEFSRLLSLPLISMLFLCAFPDPAQLK